MDYDLMAKVAVFMDTPMTLSELVIVKRTLSRRIKQRMYSDQRVYIHTAILGRPGLGIEWFEFCEAASLNPMTYDHAKYDLKTR